MHNAPKRRRTGDIPWLLVATVAGIVLVVVIALVVFSGSGTSPVTPSATTTVTPTPAGTGIAGSVTTTSPVTLATTRSGMTATTIQTASTTVTVPDTGVTIRVDYIGSFSGSYGDNDQTQTVTNSGTRIYTLENASGTVTASFKKNDASIKHALKVEIYRDGKLLNSGSTSAAYGDVTVTTQV